MLKVAVIDSNAISRDLLATLLVNAGYEIVGSGNTSAAQVARLMKLQPQIVCVDAGTEQQERMETLETLRSGLPKALIFMVSGNFDADAIKAAAERGARGFIVKPFNSKTVLATIRGAIVKLAKASRKDS